MTLKIRLNNRTLERAIPPVPALPPAATAAGASTASPASTALAAPAPSLATTEMRGMDADFSPKFAEAALRLSRLSQAYFQYEYVALPTADEGAAFKRDVEDVRGTLRTLNAFTARNFGGTEKTDSAAEKLFQTVIRNKIAQLDAELQPLEKFANKLGDLPKIFTVLDGLADRCNQAKPAKDPLNAIEKLNAEALQLCTDQLHQTYPTLVECYWRGLTASDILIKAGILQAGIEALQKKQDSPEKRSEKVYEFCAEIINFQCASEAEKKEFDLPNLYAALPQDIRQQIEVKVWELAGKPQIPEYGKNHVFTDLNRLKTIVCQLPEFPKFTVPHLLMAGVELIGENVTEKGVPATLKQRVELELFFQQLPPEICNKIYANIYQIAKRAPNFTTNDPHFGKNACLLDMVRLKEAIQMLPEYDPNYNTSTPPETPRVAGSPPNEKTSGVATAASDSGKKTGKVYEPVYLFLVLLQGQHTTKAFPDLNARVLAALEGGKDQERLLPQPLCDALYGELYHRVKPTTMDPQWGRNNVGKHLTDLIALLKAKIS